MEKMMRHEEHGYMKVYDVASLKEYKRSGWQEMSKAELEAYYSPGVSDVDDVVEDAGKTVNQYLVEMLDKPIKDILPELDEMSLYELAELLEMETAGQGRSTLIKEIGEELEVREMQENANRQ